MLAVVDFSMWPRVLLGELLLLNGSEAFDTIIHGFAGVAGVPSVLLLSVCLR